LGVAIMLALALVFFVRVGGGVFFDNDRLATYTQYLVLFPSPNNDLTTLLLLPPPQPSPQHSMGWSVHGSLIHFVLLRSTLLWGFVRPYCKKT